MIDLERLTDKQKAAFWIYGAMDYLADKGVVTGYSRLAPRAIAIWDQLDAGWRPTDDLIESVVGNDYDLGVLWLILGFRDHREDIDKHIKAHKEKRRNAKPTNETKATSHEERDASRPDERLGLLPRLQSFTGKAWSGFHLLLHFLCGAIRR